MDSQKTFEKGRKKVGEGSGFGLIMETKDCRPVV